MNFTATICPYCGCGCGLNLVSVDGNVKGVEPWKRSPVNEGKLCPKGNYSYEFINHEDRLKYPLIRENNGFRKAKWDETLGLIASKLKKIKEEDPDALGFLGSARCTNEDNYIFQKFARTVIGTNNVDNCANLCHGPSVVGLSLTFGSGAMTNSIDDLEESNCIFIIGSNPLEQHPLIGRRVLRAKRKGAKIIVVDPRYTSIARFADLFLPLKPGTDVALINSLMNVILEEGLEDSEFINKRTTNFEELKEHIKDFKPYKVEKVTCTPENLIKEAALMYTQADNAVILYCLGITEHVNGTDNVISLANLAMLTGNIGKRGSGLNPLRGQNNVQGSCDMGVLPYFYPGYQKVVINENREKMEDIWQCGELNYLPGLQLSEMMEAAHQGSINGLYLMGENPMVADPDLGHVKESLEGLELLVVQDIFLTETAELADFVLPAACFAEKNGTFTNTERRVRRVRKAANSPGEAMEDWMIISELARKMGSDLFNFKDSSEILNEIRKVTPQYEGMDLSRINKPEGLQWPCPTEDHPGTAILHRNSFSTPDGKGVFYKIKPNNLTEVQDPEYPFILTTGRVIFQFQTGTMTMRSETLKEQYPESYVEINNEDAIALGIMNGEKLNISSKIGEIDIKARITSDIMEGVVFIPFHFAEGEEVINILTCGESLDPISKMPSLKLCPVKIRKS